MSLGNSISYRKMSASRDETALLKVNKDNGKIAKYSFSNFSQIVYVLRLIFSLYTGIHLSGDQINAYQCSKHGQFTCMNLAIHIIRY